MTNPLKTIELRVPIETDKDLVVTFSFVTRWLRGDCTGETGQVFERNGWVCRECLAAGGDVNDVFFTTEREELFAHAHQHELMLRWSGKARVEPAVFKGLEDE